MTHSELFTQSQLELLSKNGSKENHGKNHVPVAILRVQKLGYTFFITERDTDDPDMFFGLLDYDTRLRIGHFSLTLLEKQVNQSVKKPKITSPHDVNFKYNLAVYAMAAESMGTIIKEDWSSQFPEVLESFKDERSSDPQQNVTLLKRKLTW